ncbi:hypothetical protein LguiB_024943 [Lonicera macranthoides]
MSQTPESKTPLYDHKETLEDQEVNREGEEEAKEDDEEEEEGECGFCLFMKGGDCKDTFIEWEKCVEEAEKNEEDIVDKCSEATSALMKCMEAHPDYYAPIMRTKKSVKEEFDQQGLDLFGICITIVSAIAC